MAVDNRPFKSKEQDGQGNEVIIRDQQLVEQASQTTMASGEYFEIVDVDGRMAKIPKANMVDIVREALGTLLNGLSDQTTVTKVPSLNGNTLGASTVATLASVLGVPVKETKSTSAGIIRPNSVYLYGVYTIDFSKFLLAFVGRGATGTEPKFETITKLNCAGAYLGANVQGTLSAENFDTEHIGIRYFIIKCSE